MLSQHFCLPTKQLKTSLWLCGLVVPLISGSCAASGVMGLGAGVGFGVSEWDAVVKLGAKPLSPNTGSEEIVGLSSEIGIRRPSFVKCPEKT